MYNKLYFKLGWDNDEIVVMKLGWDVDYVGGKERN